MTCARSARYLHKSLKLLALGVVRSVRSVLVQVIEIACARCARSLSPYPSTLRAPSEASAGVSPITQAVGA